MNSLIEQLNEEYSNISHENEIITILNIVNDISLSFNIDIENNEYFVWDSNGGDYTDKLKLAINDVKFIDHYKDNYIKLIL